MNVRISAALEIDPKLCPPSGLTGGRGSRFVLDRNLNAYASAADPSEFASSMAVDTWPKKDAGMGTQGVRKFPKLLWGIACKTLLEIMRRTRTAHSPSVAVLSCSH